MNKNHYHTTTIPDIAFVLSRTVELDDGNLPEVPPPLSYSGSLCRSHQNLFSDRSGVLSSPKQHAGEAPGQECEYRFIPGACNLVQSTAAIHSSH